MSDITLENKSGKKLNWLLPVLLVVIVGAVVGILALSGAFSPTTSNTAQPETPQALWESQDIDSYHYTLQVGCFCPPEVREPVIIEVVNGEVASITYAVDGTAANPEFFEQYNTVDKLFTVINDAEAQDPARSEITYDETYGVPLSVTIDLSEQIADEEIYLTVSDFEPIQ